MKQKSVYLAWGALYCLCVGFGFVTNPAGLGEILLIALGLAFFAPPYYLAWQAIKEKNRKTMLVLRLISGSVLALSLLFLILNVMAVNFSAHTGLVLHVLLVMFSAPMICGQIWVVSLFLWACLLMISLRRLPA